VYPSGADFLMVRMNRPVAAVIEHLLQRHSILIKDVSGKFPPPEQYARVAVRTPADNQRLIAALSGL
jgi:histidinol-phosphate/aromatic aminotransferase/cobyric acid decarboxylase-like protein